MAEIKNQQEPIFPTKRKPDVNCELSEELPNKAQKLRTLDHDSLPSTDDRNDLEANPNSNDNTEVPNSNRSSVTEDKLQKFQSDFVAEEGGNKGNEVDSDEKYDDRDEDEDEDEDENEDSEESNGQAVVDPKGKGVIRDEKGKGKLIEEDDDSDDEDSDSGDDGGISDVDSDLSDDPLAEVDLNNILPSRTRRCSVHPGVYIADDVGNDDEDDDSDA